MNETKTKKVFSEMRSLATGVIYVLYKCECVRTCAMPKIQVYLKMVFKIFLLIFRIERFHIGAINYLIYYIITAIFDEMGHRKHTNVTFMRVSCD